MNQRVLLLAAFVSTLAAPALGQEPGPGPSNPSPPPASTTPAPAAATTPSAATAVVDANAWQLHPFELGVFLGAHVFSANDRLGRPLNSPSNHALDNAATFGMRLSWLPHWILAIEGEIALIPTQTHDGASRVTGVGWRLQALVHVLKGRIRPFLLVGIGGLNSSPSDTNVAQEQINLDPYAGVGLKIELRQRWGVRAEGRINFAPSVDPSATMAPSWDFIASFYGRFGG